MKNLTGLSIAAILLSSPAIADDDNVLSTPPLTLGTSLVCLAANVGKRPVTLVVELHDVNGAVVASENCKLPPGAVNAGGQQCSAVEAAPEGFVGYCTFTVSIGAKQDIRAAILAQDANQGIGAMPTALSAR
jgi:hypothetical protein